MFTRDTLITNGEGKPIELGAIADIGDSSPLVTTKDDTAQMVQTTARSEYLEITTQSGRKIKCAPHARISLAAGGYVYAEDADHSIVETEAGPDTITEVLRNGNSGELVNVRLTKVHTVIANGIWFLVD